MPQTLLLDTNIILDYLEERNLEVCEIVEKILNYHQKGALNAATTAFNVAEVIDKLFEIHVIGDLLKEKLSYDEIMAKKGDMALFRDISENKSEKIRKKVIDFIRKNDIKILSYSFEESDDVKHEIENYKELYSIIYEYQFSSQDALIIFTALQKDVTYFLSNDQDLVDQIDKNGLMHAYLLRKDRQRENFDRDVLMNLEVDED